MSRSVCHMRNGLTATELAECYTPDEFAAIIRVSVETVRRRCRRGQYQTARNVGTKRRPQWRIHPSELMRVVPDVEDADGAAA